MAFKFFKKKNKDTANTTPPAEASPASTSVPPAPTGKATKLGFLARLNVANKIGLVLAMLMGTIAGIVGYTLYTLEQNKTLSLLVDVASQQQVLAQRHFAEVLLATQGYESDFVGTRKLFFDTLHALTVGGLVFDLEGKSLGQVLQAPTKQIESDLTDVRDIMTEIGRKSDLLVKDKTRDAAFTTMLNEIGALNQKAYAATNQVVRNVQSHSEERVKMMIRGQLISVAIVLLLSLFMSWKIIRGIVVPLQAVVDVSLKIAQGNLLQEKIKVTSQDEIGQLSAVINTMLEGLKKMAVQTWGTTEKLSAAANEIFSATQQQAASTKQQAATVQQTTATMEQIRQSGHQISERAKEVASTAESTASTSQSGVEAVENTSKIMEAIRQQFETVAEHIINLSEKAQAVSEIITNVNDIAEQSNLLALNAAIEAAAAGEHGRSFSIVAHEIKNLADQAKQSTFQVRAILGEIQKGINSSVMLTEEAVKRVESGRATVEVSHQTITQMVKTTHESIGAFQQIMGATNQQQIGLEQMSQAMKDILQASQQTATGTGGLERAVANLNTLGQELRKAMEAYRV